MEESLLLAFFDVKAQHLKGQIKSEEIYEVIDFPNYQRKNLNDFCPESLFKV